MSIRGYAEGYYGRLLSWGERQQLLQRLCKHGLNTYYYAPKEDIWHRWQWRQPYPPEWREQFRTFCQEARRYNVRVIAGIAPGLDFDFRHLADDGADFISLVSKARQLLSDGADSISLLLDDIADDFDKRHAGFTSEGEAHACLANTLADELIPHYQALPDIRSDPVSPRFWVTPRVYADELIESSPDYLPEFLSELHASHGVLYCGSDVVCRDVTTSYSTRIRMHSHHRVLVWDNLYANDYCPRRLFVGPWLGRETVTDVLLNPTGLVNTDCLLLDMMAAFLNEERVPPALQNQPTNVMDPAPPSETVWEVDAAYWQKTWRDVLERHDVPVCFEAIADYFNLPVFNDQVYSAPPRRSSDSQVFDAIEHCLWNWKSPLSREWYPYIFGLKHDLMMSNRQLSSTRVRKTQNSPLAERLLLSSE